MRPLFAGVLVAFVCVLPRLAAAGVIRGTLRVPPRAATPAAALNAYPGRAGSMPGMHASPRGLASDAVVYVDHVAADAESAPAATPAAMPSLAQKDRCF